MARLGALAELDLDHLDLLIARIDLKEVGIEAAVRVATAKVARADLPDQVTTVRAVMLRDRALTRVMRKTAALGAGVQGQNGIGRQSTKTHGRDVENAGRIRLSARRARVRRGVWRAAYPNAKVRRFQRARLHGMVDPFIALAPDIQVRAKGVVVRLGFGALVHQ